MRPALPEDVGRVSAGGVEPGGHHRHSAGAPAAAEGTSIPAPSTLWHRTAAALAGVAVDLVRDLTVAHLDHVAQGLHHRLQRETRPGPSAPEPAIVTTPPTTVTGIGQPAAVLAGALIGIAASVLLVHRR